ncbi:MAG TPA: hypothetical protein VN200_07975 [Rhodoglobus sp.]|nr:hypothetical protein [Rhodoglobus sp.]
MTDHLAQLMADDPDSRVSVRRHVLDRTFGRKLGTEELEFLSRKTYGELGEIIRWQNAHPGSPFPGWMTAKGQRQPTDTDLAEYSAWLRQSRPKPKRSFWSTIGVTTFAIIWFGWGLFLLWQGVSMPFQYDFDWNEAIDFGRFGRWPMAVAAGGSTALGLLVVGAPLWQILRARSARR